MSTPREILSEALALSVEERAKLVQELLASLDERTDSDASEAWLSEIERRLREVDDGSAKLEEWSTVRARLADRWRR